MLATLLLVLVAGAASGCASSTERPPANFNPPACCDEEGAPPAPDSSDRRAIRALLRRQERAWNQGDLEAFMRGYARTDTLRFASGGAVRTGWEETLARYRQRYPDRQAMGTLSFSDLDVQLLSGRHAMVFGRWTLRREDTASSAAGAPSAGGLFTLLFEKSAAEDGRPAWRIVHDHTSLG